MYKVTTHIVSEPVLSMTTYAPNKGSASQLVSHHIMLLSAFGAAMKAPKLNLEGEKARVMYPDGSWIEAVPVTEAEIEADTYVTEITRPMDGKVLTEVVVGRHRAAMELYGVMALVHGEEQAKKVLSELMYAPEQINWSHTFPTGHKYEFYKKHQPR